MDSLDEAVHARYDEKEKLFGTDMMRWLERRIVLDVVDGQWKDHLLTLDHLKEGIGLRGYGQKDPLVEFKKEAFILFEDMMGRITSETVRYLFLVQPAKPEDEASEIERRQRRAQQNLQFQAGPAQAEAPKPVRTGGKVGRNDACPCGSGKKYKKCHGTNA
jgi:preprotein translocase subunit SecA